MKIAVNTRFLIKDQLEGIGWFTYQTCKRLTQSHPEHEFLFLFDRPYDEQFIFADNITPLVVPPPARHPLLWYIWFEITLPQVFKKHNPDLFLSPDGYLSLTSIIPTLLVIHDLAFEHYPYHLPFSTRHYYRYFSKKFAQRADKIATVSQFSKDDIIAHYNIDATKIDVVYDGAHPAFSPIEEATQNQIRSQYTNGQPYFLYVGALHPRKNIEQLLLAFNRFKEQTDNPVKLLIVGRKAWHSASIESTYKQLKYREDIIFTGHINEVNHLSNIMASALSLIYVSKFEGFGLPVLEAMNCHTPVITSDCSSMPEIADGAALTVDPFSVSSITRGMKQIYNDTALRERLIKNGRERAQAFSWDKTSRRLWQSLEKLQTAKVPHPVFL